MIRFAAMHGRAASSGRLRCNQRDRAPRMDAKRCSQAAAWEHSGRPTGPIPLPLTDASAAGRETSTSSSWVRKPGVRSVTPAEGGVLVHTAAARRTAYRVSVDQCPSILPPARAMPQPRQRRAAEGIERLPTGAAAVARQAMGLASPPAGPVMAVRVDRGGIEDPPVPLPRPPFLAQDLNRTPTLNGCQLVGLR